MSKVRSGNPPTLELAGEGISGFPGCGISDTLLVPFQGLRAPLGLRSGGRNELWTRDTTTAGWFASTVTPMLSELISNVLWVDLTGMFLLGLLGGGHCVGMCGPIALAVCPAAGGQGASLSVVLYNLGRVVTYTAIGGVVGAVGGSVGGLVPVLRVQLWLTLLAGVLMAWFGLALLRVLSQPRWMFAIDGGKFPGVGKLLRGVVRDGKGWLALPLGLLLGFLPCGLSVAAFSRALSADSFLIGALLVAAFGVGTLPAMVFVSWAGGRLSTRMRQFGEMIAGMILLAMAVQHVSKAVGALMG